MTQVKRVDSVRITGAARKQYPAGCYVFFRIEPTPDPLWRVAFNKIKTRTPITLGGSGNIEVDFADGADVDALIHEVETAIEAANAERLRHETRSDAERSAEKARAKTIDEALAKRFPVIKIDD